MTRQKTYRVYDKQYGPLYVEYQASSADDALDKYMSESGYASVYDYAREHGLDPDDVYDSGIEFRVEEVGE